MAMKFDIFSFYVLFRKVTGNRRKVKEETKNTSS